MKDLNLECLPDWRFCNIPYGEKGPRYSGWQNTPIELKNINANGNIGVLLGPHSNGICALDFDGPTAWTWFIDRFPDLELPTIKWASGRESRCQMAFKIPEEYWDALKTIKIETLAPSALGMKDGEGFEFRWTGGQSVLPPSRHPDTKKDYFWISSPVNTNVIPLPNDILVYWLLQANPVPVPVVVYPPISNQEADDLARKLKNLYPSLGYDTWARVTWGFCNTIGYGDGIQLMKQYWPEQKPGDYAILGTKPPKGKQYKLGTIKKMIYDQTPRVDKRIKSTINTNKI
jgi:hypothetical protein